MWYSAHQTMFLAFILSLLPLAFARHHNYQLLEEFQQDKEWHQFMREFGKNYPDISEHLRRRQIFHQNKQIIAEHNERYQQGLETYTLAMNHFGDMTSSEFKNYIPVMNYTEIQNHLKNSASHYVPPALSSFQKTPKDVDWRKLGAVTEVKNQGRCGSCWAFSTTGAIEGQHFRHTGYLVNLSEQNLIDCCKSNKGCNGGNPIKAYECVKENNGIDTTSDYHYEGKENKCRYNPKYSGATVRGYTWLQQSEPYILDAVANVGPVSVCVDATEKFQFYSSGIFYDESCSSTKLNHAVLLVGYGGHSYGSYWLIKNSWSQSWGEGGYMKLARNGNNNCGIFTLATYPLV